MPEWLLKEQEYTPLHDRDTFINKSILSLLHILSRIRAQSGYKTDKFHVNTFFKVAFIFMLILLLAISRSFTFVLIVNIYLLVIISSMQASDIIKILRLSIIVAAFTYVILLPAAILGDSYSSVMITSKVFASAASVNILSHSTRWDSITSALKRFFIPDIFILVLDITIKYITMLGDFCLNMLYSLKMRSVGRNSSKYAALSGIAGTMFIKSKEMAEDMYAAMECRGFTGEYRIRNKFRMTLADYIYILINAGILYTFFYLGRS